MRQRAAIAGVSMMTVLAALAMTAGCENRSTTRAVFTRPELHTYERLAVLGLDPEQEQLFMAAYIKTFIAQPITFVERGELAKIIGEQDLRQGRLNEKTRARIKQILGVEALILCEYSEDEAHPGAMKLRVRVVNSETGAIAGSAIPENCRDFEVCAKTAVAALKADLFGETSRRPYAPPAEPEGAL